MQVSRAAVQPAQSGWGCSASRHLLYTRKQSFWSVAFDAGAAAVVAVPAAALDDETMGAGLDEEMRTGATLEVVLAGAALVDEMTTGAGAAEVTGLTTEVMGILDEGAATAIVEDLTASAVVVGVTGAGTAAPAPFQTAGPAGRQGEVSGGKDLTEKKDGANQG